MYHKRLTFLIVFFVVAVLAAFLRLFQLQVFQKAQALDNIEQIGIKAPEIIPTLRGSITDRNGKILAIDSAEFYIAIRYNLARLRDERFWDANAIIRADGSGEDEITKAREYWEDYFSSDIQILDTIVAATVEFCDVEAENVEAEIAAVNERMWRMRRYFAWKRNFPDSESIEDDYNVLDSQKRLELEGMVNDLAEMRNDWYMLAKITSDDLYKAQVFFRDVEEVKIIPKASRNYPYGSIASQIIGWVNPQQRDNEIFASDELLKYQPDELSGYKGVEYVCEPLLRGKRGKLVYKSSDGEPLEQAREFGRNVRLTIDVELQKNVENILIDPLLNPNSNANCAAVILDVPTGEILAAVSIPSFDLNTARQDFGKLISDSRRPLEHKALQAIYPPGSTVKPIVLAAGLESGKITANTVISCPLPAEEGWPRCWLQRQYGCHDDQFAADGGNNAVNALRGSCNIYFTKLAHRLDARTLQKCLYDFGFGHAILQSPDFTLASGEIDTQIFQGRNLRESDGIISNKLINKGVNGFEDIPLMSDGEKRWFGMGQGNIRVTVLQVANSMAVIARDGVFIEPKLYSNCGIDAPARSLGISAKNIKTIKDGLWAVVNAPHGTAYSIFKDSDFVEGGINVYGKTGSSERPDNAWFCGFAQDSKGGFIALALVIEGGQSGTRDAAPVAKEILNICVMTDYLELN